MRYDYDGRAASTPPDDEPTRVIATDPEAVPRPRPAAEDATMVYSGMAHRASAEAPAAPVGVAPERGDATAAWQPGQHNATPPEPARDAETAGPEEIARPEEAAGPEEVRTDEAAAGTVAAGAVDTGASAEATGTAAGDAAGLLPGATAAEPVATFWGDGRNQEYRDRWREVQLRFVDEPQAAVDEA